MSVWLTIPSARPPAEANKALQCWREMGYKIALWVDDLSEIATPKRIADVTTGTAEYPGYAVAVNTLIRDIWTRDPSADWISDALGFPQIPDWVTWVGIGLAGAAGVMLATRG